MESIVNVLGTMVLYAGLFLCQVVAYHIIFVKKFKKTDNWWSDVIIPVIIAGVITASVFIYNHVSFTLWLWKNISNIILYTIKENLIKTSQTVYNNFICKNYHAQQNKSL